MDFARLQQNWTNLGKVDPLWAILSERHAQNGKWDLDAFLRTGVEFVAYVARHCQGLGLLPQRERALDFGCGYGRLSQALAGWFGHVTGVDIAPSMLDGARAIDRSGGRCEFVLNGAPDLRQFADRSFDFALTVLVLQHMRPEYSTAYVRELVRVLRPGGVAFFQIPSEAFAQPLAVPAKVGAFDGGPLHAALAVHPGSLAIGAADWQWLRVDLHNRGGALPASGPGQVQVAVRWHQLEGSPHGAMALTDLPHAVPAGAQVRLLVPVRAPAAAGHWQLQLLVVRGGRWIESPSCGAARAVVQVAPRDPRAIAKSLAEPRPAPPVPPHVASGDGHADEAHIEVHAVPVHEVVAAVQAAGAEVIDVGEDNWAGPDWLSAHYTIQKR